jgi:DNA-binding CsgD family transcriptional regulator
MPYCYPTAVVFVCSDCGAVYKAFQHYAESTQLGHFDCSNCSSLVHAWHGVYNYFAWTPILLKKPRSPRLAKRLKITGPRRAPPRWTQEEEQQLLKMAKADMTASEIARSLKRTPGSIYSRLQRLYRKFGRNHSADTK